MTRILFLGDLDTTGFGTVTTDLGRALIESGEDVRFLSQNAFLDLPEPFASRTMDLSTFVMVGDAVADLRTPMLVGLFEGHSTALLSNGTPWGDWKPEAAIILGDFFATRLILATQLDDGRTVADLFRGLPSFHYAPIEGVGLPARWAETWKVVTPVAMCQFGADQIAKVTGTRPAVAYHGVDTRDFKRANDRQRSQAKLGWVNYLAEQNDVDRIPKYWLLRTDRHMPRKRYNSLLRSLAPVLARHPDWALVMHCRPWDQGGDLRDEISRYPEAMRQQFLLTNGPNLSRELLANLYQAADVYVTNSAEGFGLTIAEALACGTPVVGVKYSAVPEVIGPAGIAVPEGYLLDNEYDHFWWATSESAYGAAVEGLMTSPARRAELGRLGPKHIRRFTWKAAADVFSALIRSTHEVAA